MKKIIFILIVIILAAGAFFYFKNQTPTSSTTQSGTVKIEPITFGEATVPYAHKEYGFSFMHPADFAVTTLPANGAETIVVQNDKGQGFQILITPITENASVLTVDMIKADIPDLLIKDPQDLLIGENGKGVAFLSDNEVFGGNSREIWFVYNYALYQISTYAEHDDFLKSIFGTWKFTK